MLFEHILIIWVDESVVNEYFENFKLEKYNIRPYDSKVKFIHR